MRWFGRTLCLAGLFALLPGCKMVEDRPAPHQAAATKSSPTPAAETAPAHPATPPASPVPGAPATPSPGAPGAPAANPPAPAAPAAPGASAPASPAPVTGTPAAAPAKPSETVFGALGKAASESVGQTVEPVPGEPAAADKALMGSINKATRSSVKAAVEGASLAQERAAAQLERDTRAARRLAFLQAARFHLRHLQVKVQAQDQALSSAQLALLHRSLVGIRANLGRGLVDDELSFALAALDDVDTINRSQDEAVAAGLDHLRRAQRALPPAPPGSPSALPSGAAKGATSPSASDLQNRAAAAATDDTALAARVAEIITQLEQKQRADGRNALEALVLELADDQAARLVELTEVARHSVADAVAARVWKRATWGLDRAGRLLDELQTLFGPAQPAAAPATTPAAPSGYGTPAPGPEAAAPAPGTPPGPPTGTPPPPAPGVYGGAPASPAAGSAPGQETPSNERTAGPGGGA